MYPLVKPWAVFTDHDPDAPSTHSLVLKPSWSNGPREHVPLPKVDGRAGQIWRTSFLSSHLLDWSWRNPQLERRGTGTTGDRWSASLEHCFYTSYFSSHSYLHFKEHHNHLIAKILSQGFPVLVLRDHIKFVQNIYHQSQHIISKTPISNSSIFYENNLLVIYVR